MPTIEYGALMYPESRAPLARSPILRRGEGDRALEEAWGQLLGAGQLVPLHTRGLSLDGGELITLRSTALYGPTPYLDTLRDRLDAIAHQEWRNRYGWQYVIHSDRADAVLGPWAASMISESILYGADDPLRAIDLATLALGAHPCSLGRAIGVLARAYRLLGRHERADGYEILRGRL